MEGRRLEGHIADARNSSIEEKSRIQRRIEASSQGGQDPGGVIVS
jgi:hypothetical protein